MEPDWEHILDIAESLLRPQCDHTQAYDPWRCSRCEAYTIIEDGVAGHLVCTSCATVQSATVYGVDWQVHWVHSKSNYKRIHHWHERISQLLLTESEIPAERMQQIHAAIYASGATTINKGIVRNVLRSLNMQVYIEKWLQIIWSVTGQRPPTLLQSVIIELDRRFLMLQGPFSRVKPTTRKNFLNYNYTFCRIFQLIGCPELSMFFPLIKSKAKLDALDTVWKLICDELKWPYEPLKTAPEFCLQLPPRSVDPAADAESRGAC